MEQGKSHTLHLMFTGRASAEEKESNRNFHSFPSAEWKMGRQKQKEKENRYKMAAWSRVSPVCKNHTFLKCHTSSLTQKKSVGIWLLKKRLRKQLRRLTFVLWKSITRINKGWMICKQHYFENWFSRNKKPNWTPDMENAKRVIRQMAANILHCKRKDIKTTLTSVGAAID